MAGYPDEWNVPSRNRQYSNQPGGLMKPEQPMATEFRPQNPKSDHMARLAAEIRQYPDPEPDMNYEQANFPDYEETPTFEDLPNDEP